MEKNLFNAVILVNQLHQIDPMHKKTRFLQGKILLWKCKVPMY